MHYGTDSFKGAATFNVGPGLADEKVLSYQAYDDELHSCHSQNN